MPRAPLVIAGTVIGAAGVLAFPVRQVRASPALTAAAGAPVAASSPGAAVTSISTPAPSATPASTPAPASAARSATGADQSFRFGSLAVTVTVGGGRVTSVGIANLSVRDGRSSSIDSYAIPQLEQEVVAANSATIQGISGATYTSQAFEASVSSALQKLGFAG